MGRRYTSRRREPIRVVATVQAIDLYLAAAAASMDELTLADIHADVSDAASSAGVEEHEVSRFEVAFGDFLADPSLLTTRSREVNTL